MRYTYDVSEGEWRDDEGNLVARQELFDLYGEERVIDMELRAAA